MGEEKKRGLEEEIRARVAARLAQADGDGGNGAAGVSAGDGPAGAGSGAGGPVEPPPGNDPGAGSGGDDGRPASSLVRECLAANELGDGLLFAALHRGDFVYDKSADEWLAWRGHWWERDLMGRALAAVEDVAEIYLDELADVQDELAKVRALRREKAPRPDPEAAAAVAAGPAGKRGPGRPKKAANPAGDPVARRLEGLEALAKQLRRRADKLRSEHGRQNCLKFAATNRRPLAVTGDRLDRDPWLLAVANGVIDLKTGELRAGRPEDFLTKAAPTEWLDLEAPAPLWEKTLGEIFPGSPGLIAYLQRLLGYGLTGLVTEHIFPVFQGRGRNGKSMLLDLVKEVVGPLAAPIRPELLLEQAKNRSAAAPSPDIMALRGLRLAFAEETDEGSRFSSARVKWLTGGTELTGRNPHDKYDTIFKPSHLLILCTNNRPAAPASDYAFWSRMRLLEFNVSFVDEPKAEHERQVDKTLGERILASEAAGILAWLVRGCLLWQAEGLNPPDEVKQATHNYQRSEDMVGDFIDECLEPLPDDEPGPDRGVKSSEIYQLFLGWYQVTQGRRPPSQKWFSNQMVARGYDKRKAHGVMKFFGLRINFAGAEEYLDAAARGRV